MIHALEGPIRRGAVIGLELAELTFMYSIGVKAVLVAADGVGRRGRVVAVRRVIDLCGIGARIDISDDPSLAHPNGHDGDRPHHPGGAVGEKFGS